MMTFEDLQVGEIYYDENPGEILLFVEMRNSQLATFKRCVFNDDTNDIDVTDENIYLTLSEVKRINK